MATFATGWKFLDAAGHPRVLSGKSVQAIGEISDAANYALGTRVKAVDPVLGEGEFVYGVGVASTADKEVVQINAAFTTTRTATPKGPVGIAMGAIVANKYGWYQVKGRGVAKIAADFVTGAVYMSATPGTVQSTVIAGSHLVGAVGEAASDAAGGSAIVGTTATTAAHTAVVAMQDPYGVGAV
jgi:hypothetical protein